MMSSCLFFWFFFVFRHCPKEYKFNAQVQCARSTFEEMHQHEVVPWNITPAWHCSDASVYQFQSPICRQFQFWLSSKSEQKVTVILQLRMNATLSLVKSHKDFQLHVSNGFTLKWQEAAAHHGTFRNRWQTKHPTAKILNFKTRSSILIICHQCCLFLMVKPATWPCIGKSNKCR